jgi:hypothetical protein
MRRILFVDHPFHGRTASSAFFADLLRERFEVDAVAFDPQRPDRDLLAVAPGYFAAVLWQLDYLAPIFLGQGLRTLVIPMYDGSANLSDEHWLAARGGAFLNFSRALHERIRMLGLPSKLVKYFPPPAREDALPSFDTLRGFLWLRRPEEGIDVPLVARLFGNQLSALHVHNAPDNPYRTQADAGLAAAWPFTITQSTWFERGEDYLARLADCNVFIAPRAAEGIGMAMLEAMARGMLVLANDQPTHNEYICNWVNGVLFNKDAAGLTDFGAAAAVARRGWQTVREGYPVWLAQAAEIADYVEALPAARALAGRDLDRLIRTIPASFAQGRDRYERTIAGVVAMRLTDEQADGFDGESNTFVPARNPWAPILSAPAGADSGMLGVIDFANGAARPYLRQGWSFDEPGWTWVEGLRATLAFRLPRRIATDLTLRCFTWTATGYHPAPLAVGVLLNGHYLQELRPTDTTAAVELRVPMFMLQAEGENELVFVMSSAFHAANDGRRISCAFCRLEFLERCDAPAGAGALAGNAAVVPADPPSDWPTHVIRAPALADA